MAVGTVVITDFAPIRGTLPFLIYQLATLSSTSRPFFAHLGYPARKHNT
jgi:hypothetical protein